MELRLKRAASRRIPKSLVPMNVVGDNDARRSLLRIGDHVVARPDRGARHLRAARDLLLRRPPPSVKAPAHLSRGLGRPTAAAARRIAVDRRPTSTLAIQGPPGSGKTYTGARMIVDLIAPGGASASPRTATRSSATCWRGRRAAARACDPGADRAEGTDRTTIVDVARVGRDGERGGRPDCRRRRYDVVGRHALAVGPDGMRGSWTSCSSTRPTRCPSPTSSPCRGAAHALVLLGDPQQLDQPIQGTHPPGGGGRRSGTCSATHDTMPARARPVPGAHLAAASRDRRVHVEGVLRAKLDSQARARAQGPRRRSLAGSGFAGCPSNTPATTRLDRGGAAIADLIHGARQSGSTMDRCQGRPAAADARRHPRRHAVQRPGRRDR